MDVGEETACDLANYVDTIEGVAGAYKQELEGIENIGEVVAGSVYEWFANSANQKLLNKFIRAGVRIENPLKQTKNQNLKGITFVLTGTMKGLAREEAERLVRERGGSPST